MFFYGVCCCRSWLTRQDGFAAETGRQPWVVYNLLRTSDALSAAVTAEQVWFSLIMFTVVYMLLFSIRVFNEPENTTRALFQTC